MEAQELTEKKLMEFTVSLIVWWSGSFSAALVILLRLLKSRKNSIQKRPPGPKGWPIFGNIFDLGTVLPHQTLYRLRFRHGPVMWLRLGAINTMVVQSGKAAAELFRNHDLPFSDRKVPSTLTAHNYDQSSVAVGKYGAYWRTIRKVCSHELLANKRVNETSPIRRKCLDDMIRWIEEEAAMSLAVGGLGEVELPRLLFCMLFNLVGNITLSRDMVDMRCKEGNEFYDSMNGVMQWAGYPNLADFFPFLEWLDPQGLKRNMMQDMGRVLNIISIFLHERVEERQSGTAKEKAEGKDFLDVLLDYKGAGKEGPAQLSNENVNLIILEMFFAGTETTSSAIEWAMTELLRSPESLLKAKQELDRVVGPKRMVEESDIDELPYLQATVKETLRLHPPIPLLLPRNALQDTSFMGYLIPKNTRVLVNAWAIGRDPEAWDNPLSFQPERFLGSNIDYKGHSFGLIPFGSGRRMCLGVSLAHRVLHLALGSLLHCFEWELGGGVSPETIDVTERGGITLRKRSPLKVIPKRRIHL